MFSTVQGKQVEVTTSDIAEALKCNDEHPLEGAQLTEQPKAFYVSEIIEDMCTRQYADDKRNVGSRSKLPPQLWLVDSILYRNVCPLGHKSQRHDQFLQALYNFHKGHWYSISSIIWSQIYKFWDWALARQATTTKSWGLPFPFLLTHILKKKGIKGTLEDGPVTEHLFFGKNQWNHSQSHMPRGVRVQIPADEGGDAREHMDEDAPAPPPPQGGRNDSVAISRTEYEFLSGAYQGMDRLEQRFANMETQSATQTTLLKAILKQLPLVVKASSSGPHEEQ